MTKRERRELESFAMLARYVKVYDSTFAVMFQKRFKPESKEDELEMFQPMLPLLRELNKCIELNLKKACIDVTGIWQADDDGILNPANIKLVPGAIIPKAVGASGLKRLESKDGLPFSESYIKSLRAAVEDSFNYLTKDFNNDKQ